MKISTICISKNCEDLVDETIKSFAKQNLLEKEIIFIDNLSNDGTVRQIKNSCKKYNVRDYLLISESDKGISDAMNKGWLLAKGDIINFLHFGDCYASNKVFVEVSTSYKKIKFDIFSGGAIYNYSTQKSFLSFPKNIDKIYFSNTFPHMSVFIKTSLRNQIGLYDTSLSMVMDYDLWFRAYIANKKFCYSKKILVNLKSAGESSKYLAVLNDFIKCKFKHLCLSNSVFERFKIFNSFFVILIKVLGYAIKSKL